MVLAYDPAFLTLVDTLVSSTRKRPPQNYWARSADDICADIREHRLEWAAGAAESYLQQVEIAKTPQGEVADRRRWGRR